MKNQFFIGAAIAAIFSLASMGVARADSYTNGSYLFESLESAPSGSGLGGYNVILFAGAAGGSGNDGGAVDVDDSNTGLPTGGTSTSQSLFWLTSIGDLRDFYDDQFGVGAVNNIVLFLDINETGNPNANEDITIGTLSIYHNELTVPDPTGTNDLSSADQASLTGHIPSSTALKKLSPAQVLDQRDTGAGVDDWSIFTFIDPYSSEFGVDDTLLFNFQISNLAAGYEVLSISGALTACDISPEGCGTTSGTTGTSDPTTGTSDPTTGTSDPTTGTSDPTTGTSDPTTGTSDPTTGTSYPTTGTGSTGTDTTGFTTDPSGATTRDIPEPASFLLLGAGLFALSRVARRKRD